MPKSYGYIPSKLSAIDAYYATLMQGLLYGANKEGSDTPPENGNINYIKGVYSLGYGRSYTPPTGATSPEIISTGFWTAATPLENPFPDFGNVPGWKEAYYWNTQDQLKGKLTAAYVKNSRLLLTRYIRTTVIPVMIARPDIWSDDDLRSYGIRPRHVTHHAPLPAPQVAPIVSLRLGMGHDIKVSLAEEIAGGHIKYLVSTKGIKGCVINWRFYDDANPPLGDTSWNQIVTSKLKHIINFNASDAGQKVQFRAAFTSPTLQPGPWSNYVYGYVT